MYTPKWMPPMPFRLNLQRFADGADPAAGNDGEDKGGDGAGEGADNKEKGKTFSQDDVTAIAAKEAKKAREKVFKDLGLDPNAPPKDLKERLGKLKEHEDAQKTDLEKAQGSNTTLTKERDEATAKAELLQRKFAAVAKGVPADKAERYVKLAESYLGEDGDFEKALDAALKDFPVAAAQPEKKGSAGSGANPGAAAGDKTKENNPGRAAAMSRRQQLKRSNDALKNYTTR